MILLCEAMKAQRGQVEGRSSALGHGPPLEAGRENLRGHALHTEGRERSIKDVVYPKAEAVLLPPQNILPSGQMPRSQGSLGRRA